MTTKITVNECGEQTELQNQKWLELSAKLFQMPGGELSDYADWLDEFSDVELLMYCRSDYHRTEKFREFFERWDKPNFDRLLPLVPKKFLDE